jgi:hypothetical protein
MTRWVGLGPAATGEVAVTELASAMGADVWQSAGRSRYPTTTRADPETEKLRDDIRAGVAGNAAVHLFCKAATVLEKS